MMTLNLPEDSIDCPLCGSSMIWDPQMISPNEKISDREVHQFVCSDEHREDCKCKWTAWNLKIVGMDDVEVVKRYVRLRRNIRGA